MSATSISIPQSTASLDTASEDLQTVTGDTHQAVSPSKASPVKRSWRRFIPSLKSSLLLLLGLVLGGSAATGALLPIALNPFRFNEEPYWLACASSNTSTVSILRYNNTVWITTYFPDTDEDEVVVQDFHTGISVSLSKGVLQHVMPLVAEPPSYLDLDGFNMTHYSPDTFPPKCPGLPGRLSPDQFSKFHIQIFDPIVGAIMNAFGIVNAALCGVRHIGRRICDSGAHICPPRCWRIVIFGITIARGCRRDCVRLFCDQLGNFICFGQ